MSDHLSDEDLERIHDLATEGEWDCYSPREVLALTTEVRQARELAELRTRIAGLKSSIDQLEAEQANAPLDVGRWVEEPVVGDIPLDRSFYRPTEEVEAAGSLLHYTVLDGERWWTINHSSSRITPLGLADDLEAAARIIRAHEGEGS